MKRIVLITLLVCAPALYTWADNQKAIEYFIYEAYGQAKEILVENLSNNTLNQQDKAEAYYYLGEIYCIEQMKDSAAYYYQEGQKASPDYAYNAIGLAKLQAATNKDAGAKALDGIAGKNKKDIDLQRAIVQAYLYNNMMEEASEQLESVKKIDAKSPVAFLAEGDIYAHKQAYGDACARYEQAIYFDAQCKEAYVKYAKMYAGINYKLSVEMLQKLTQIDASSPLPYREMGEIYYQAGQFGEAEKAYGKYIENDPNSFGDYPRYASILYHNKDFNKSDAIVQEALKRDPGNVVLNRLQMYNHYEQKKYPEGLAVGEQFMKSNKQPIALDHVYYAQLLGENKREEEAIQQYKKALELDPDKATIYRGLADIYDKTGQYEEACNYYNLFIEKGGKEVQLTDYFALGKAYYSAAGDSTNERRLEYCQKADSTFAFIAEKAPESYLGNFWRARTNSLLDPETEKGLAKPYYEAAAGILQKSNNSNHSLLIECYSYMGYYYYLQKNIPESKKYWSMILELDPQNKIATEALKGMK